MSKAGARKGATSRLGSFIASLESAGKSAFMPYITAGYPSRSSMKGILRMLKDNGADCIELGVPFSDPIADGPTIQDSSQQALSKGMSVASCLELAEYASGLGHRVVLMSYMNPLLQLGKKSLAARLRNSGVQGLVVPDLPLEYAGGWGREMDACDVALALFAAPTTPDNRLIKVGRKSRGFVYYVSITGVTGERATLAAGLAARLSTVRKLTKLPICVGFGISSPFQARQVARSAAGVIVGSALVRRLRDWDRCPGKRLEIARWTREMAQAIRSAVKS